MTHAAARLHLSQPSVSVQLARLRDFFGDPIFLPATGGMLPTARAEQLRQPLRDALDALKKATAPAATFEPAKATHTWKIAAFDYSEFTALLPTLPVIRQAAAATRLSVVQLPPLQIARRAAQGDIDLAFLIRDEAASELRYRSPSATSWQPVGDTPGSRVARHVRSSASSITPSSRPREAASGERPTRYSTNTDYRARLPCP
ncbi:LysR family transcriptional regulator [Luteibacter sp. PPL552]